MVVEDATVPPEQVEEVAAVPSALCNCWAYVRQTYPELPSMATLIAGADVAYGPIAVFVYEDGTPHIALTRGQGMGTFEIDEANYDACAQTHRAVSFADPHLVGFYQVDVVQ